MKISIIDIGTQSVKHYIFEVEGSYKKTLHYKRYSDAHLGDDGIISKEAIERSLGILKECVSLNLSDKVEKLRLVGTEGLRKAQNAYEFTSEVKKISGEDIEIITQDQEAKYLYEGFIDILPDSFEFAAINTGGGSTELVIGDKDHMSYSQKIPFGAKLLRKSFFGDSGVDWKKLDAHLLREIHVAKSADTIFVTGVLDFISVVGPRLGFITERCDIPHHPIKLTLNEYLSYLDRLRNTPIEDLKKIYVKDPGFCDNVAIAQSVYTAVASKLGVRYVIPSNSDLTDGVIYEMTH